MEMAVIIDEVHDDGAIGRTYADAPEIDGKVYLDGAIDYVPGDMVMVHIDSSDEYDLRGHVVIEEEDDGWDW